MKSFHIYILRCSDGSYYTGHTDNIEKRISEHRLGVGDSYTTSRLPIEVVFASEFNTRHEALEMEQRIKKWSRSKKEALIKQDWQKLISLSKKKFTRNGIY